MSTWQIASLSCPSSGRSFVGVVLMGCGTQQRPNHNVLRSAVRVARGVGEGLSYKNHYTMNYIDNQPLVVTFLEPSASCVGGRSPWLHRRGPPDGDPAVKGARDGRWAGDRPSSGVPFSLGRRHLISRLLGLLAVRSVLRGEDVNLELRAAPGGHHMALHVTACAALRYVGCR